MLVCFCIDAVQTTYPFIKVDLYEFCICSVKRSTTNETISSGIILSKHYTVKEAKYSIFHTQPVATSISTTSRRTTWCLWTLQGNHPNQAPPIVGQQQLPPQPLCW